MAILRTDDLAVLLASREGPCVSLFMPTHRKGRDTQQDPIRFKNLLRKAVTELKGVAIRGGTVEDLLAPARALLGEKDFWEHASDGLAAFLTHGFSRIYRLPATLPERVVVADAFHLKPLLPLLSGDGLFYVLAISQNHVRLLQGTRFSVGELEPDGMPRSLKEALWMDDPEKSLQYHTGTSSRGGARRAAVYHGQGDLGDVEKTNLLRYFRRVDEGLTEFLEGEHAPLVLAGVEHYFPIYREANNYPRLVASGVRGSPDDLSAADLHARAWQVVEPLFQKDQEEARARYRELKGSPRVSDDIPAIVRAAHHGRVESLFAARGQQRWGAWIPAGEGSVILHDKQQPGDVELLDVSAAETLRHRGRVYAVSPEAMPEAGQPLTAILRY